MKTKLKAAGYVAGAIICTYASTYALTNPSVALNVTLFLWGAIGAATLAVAAGDTLIEGN